MDVKSTSLMCLLALSMGTQAVAAKTVFIRPEGISWRMWGVVLWFLTCGATQFFVLASAAVSLTGWGAACVLHLASLWLFRAACRANRDRVLSVVYSTDTPRTILTHGPYRTLRHPFYASYLLAWLAGVVATASLILTALFFLTVLLYTHAAGYEERKILRSGLGQQYQRYRQRTYMIIPGIS